jgi:maltooligosyltrehalose trehalohydrolase
VREGRRREFAKFPEFQDPASRERIPDPGADDTFARSILDWSAFDRPALDQSGPKATEHAVWLDRYRALIALRAREIVPRLPGTGGHAGQWRAIGEKAVVVSWRLGDRSRLTLVANFSTRHAVVPDTRPNGRLLYASVAMTQPGEAPPVSATFFLAAPEPE